MTTMKTPYPCDECEGGSVETVKEDYVDLTPDGNTIVVPDVEMHRCGACGVLLIPATSSRYISENEARVKTRAWRKPIPRRTAQTPAAEPVFAALQPRSGS